MLGLLVAAADKGAIPDVLEARALHIVGDEGAVLIKLEGGEMGRITTLNEKGQPLLNLTTSSSDGGVILANDRNGRPLVTLGAGTRNGV